MDNRQVDVTSEGDEALWLAIRLAWPGAAGGKATHYKTVGLAKKTVYYGEPTSGHSTSTHEVADGTPTLILLWHAERDALPLPYPLELDDAIQFVAGWLRNVPRGRRPNHDGDNGEGWRVFTESWGHVAGHQYAIVAAQPVWAMYGK